jgi:endonuclease-8
VPEGDTIVRAARTLQRALAGEVITRFESVYPALTRIDHDRPLAGRTVEAVSSRGKHLLMTFSGNLTLHTHMRMHGSWHIYRPGERWQRPGRDMRVLLETAPFVAVGFNIPVAELLTAEQLARHAPLQALGPDLADPAFDSVEVLLRVRAHNHDTLEQLLLNQRVAAGVGNVLKSEALFMAGLNPFVPAEQVDDDRLRTLIAIAARLIASNVAARESTLSPAIGRRTTNSLDPDEKLWVYSRGGKPCRRCGTAIRSKAAGSDARLTYWCPECQKHMDL